MFSAVLHSDQYPVPATARWEIGLLYSVQPYSLLRDALAGPVPIAEIKRSHRIWRGLTPRPGACQADKLSSLQAKFETFEGVVGAGAAARLRLPANQPEQAIVDLVRSMDANAMNK